MNYFFRNMPVLTPSANVSDEATCFDNYVTMDFLEAWDQTGEQNDYIGSYW